MKNCRETVVHCTPPGGEVPGDHSVSGVPKVALIKIQDI